MTGLTCGCKEATKRLQRVAERLRSGNKQAEESRWLQVVVTAIITVVLLHCVMQVRKHKEQAEWAEKKYAELDRYSIFSLQFVKSETAVLQCSLLCLPTAIKTFEP